MKGPPSSPPAAEFIWTGFYVGANLGGAWDSDEYHFLTVGTFSHNAAGGIFGVGQAGYNYEISSFVLGAEGDIDGAGLASRNFCPNPFFHRGHNIDWLA